MLDNQQIIAAIALVNLIGGMGFWLGYLAGRSIERDKHPKVEP